MANRIYSATYSNVPVYEFNVSGNHVMRRRADDWINATHILKVAEYDKPARTRILEREVQKGTHEKVQGGYGKYQGTWIPLHDGRYLAERNGCFDKLQPIFDFVPGDRSPPPAPKHATNASGKPRVPRQPAQPRRVPVPPRARMNEVSYDDYVPAAVNDTPENETVSESEDDLTSNAQHTGSRKRRRQAEEPQIMSAEEQQHLLWSDELLDYFMLQKSDEPLPPAPEPLSSIDLNRPVDEKGHTPLHWAAAMGDLNLVREFQQRGARITSLTANGETPLMRAVTFTNNWDRQTMGRLIDILHETVGYKDWFGSTVLHHIAVSTCSKSKYGCAKYYLDTILQRVSSIYRSEQIHELLDHQDHNGDTAVMLAARFGARKCVRSLIEHGASADIPNYQGDTASNLIKELNARRKDRFRQGSSSPLQPPNGFANSQDPASQASNSSSQSKANHYASEAATLVASQLPTLITSRTEALAIAMETELLQREQEAQDSDALLKHRQEDIANIRQTIEELSDQVDIGTDDAAESEELQELLSELTKLYESEQRHELQRQIQMEMAKIKATESATAMDSNDGNLSEKLAVAYELHREQRVQTDLCTELAAAQSAVAARRNHDRQDIYKRLIIGALGVKAEDVEQMLPDILAELEDAHRETAAIGITDAPLDSKDVSNGHHDLDLAPSTPISKLGMYGTGPGRMGGTVGVMA
ncbi:MAG: hypothetical protein M1828_004060 [Chrysothrix sp. TS-e1954]|nr:MAG: hypothetical protein M1828_004060 [Chrysothrix sp. TS-e1954]